MIMTCLLPLNHEFTNSWAKSMISCTCTTCDDSLYAAAGDPKNLERGGRPYWLLCTASSRAFQTKSKLRAFGHAKSPIFKAKTWVVRAQWYVSTADNPRAKRQSYKLLPDYVYITVPSIIQEHDLQFKHEGRSSSNAECTLDDAAHDRIMSHNFASYI